MKKKFISCLLAILMVGFVIAQSKKQNQTFLEKQIAVLEKIKPLQSAQKDTLSSVFWEEIGKTKNPKELIAFNIAMSKALKDKIYFKEYYKDDLEKQAWALYQDDYNYYKYTMKLSDASLQEIKPQLLKRSMELALCEVQYYAYPTERYKKKSAIKEKFQDKISTTSIKKDSKGLSYNLKLILENKNKLKLTDAQVDSIVEAAKTVKSLQRKGVLTPEKGNTWECERMYIMHFLTESQLSEFLTLRNVKYAYNSAQKMWQEMKKYNIAVEYDSIEVIKQVCNYYISKNKVSYVYKDNPTKLKEMDDYVYKSFYPKALRQLNVEKRKNNDPESSEKNTLAF